MQLQVASSFRRDCREGVIVIVFLKTEWTVDVLVGYTKNPVGTEHTDRQNDVRNVTHPTIVIYVVRNRDERDLWTRIVCCTFSVIRTLFSFYTPSVPGQRHGRTDYLFLILNRSIQRSLIYCQYRKTLFSLSFYHPGTSTIRVGTCTYLLLL